MQSTTSASSLCVFLLHSALATALFCILRFSQSSVAMFSIVGILLLYVVFYRRLDYLDPLVVFLLPWFLILAFSLVPLSEYAVSIRHQTISLVIIAMLAALMSSGQRHSRPNIKLIWKDYGPAGIWTKLQLAIVDMTFIGFTLLNIAIAGYVPIIRGLQTGNTGYLDFGVHGLYGFYLAFANALGIFHFILYLRTSRFKHMAFYLLIMATFVIFVTRQNLLSLLGESVIVYSLVCGRVKRKTLIILVLFAGVAFSIIGSFRSGDIKQLVNVQAQYMWVPAPFVWLYAYSYFNIANVNNMMHFSNAPYYDGSSFSQLIPSFLRPTYTTESYLEVPLFNVSSYLYPVYEDLGTAGVVLLTMAAIGLAQRGLRRTYTEASLFRVGTFATLYFCSGFSFFVNFWFYLPIIFQIFFFFVLSGTLERVTQIEMRKEINLLPGADLA